MRLLFSLAALLLLLACACENAAETASPAATVSATTTRTAPATGTVGASPGATAPPALTMAVVTHVVDGDTIDVEVAGAEYTVRYIGVNTPETVDPRRGVECFGPEASAFNKQLVEGQTVGLEKDVSEVDQYGRLLRYVWVGSEMVNATLVREGYAQASTYPPDVKHQDEFTELQREAAEAGRGLWGEVCAETPTATPVVIPAPGACEYSGTDEAVIKGNISAEGERIYHVPGQQYYEQTVVNEANGERWFCTEAEAVAAGWRKSKV